MEKTRIPEREEWESKPLQGGRGSESRLVMGHCTFGDACHCPIRSQRPRRGGNASRSIAASCPCGSRGSGPGHKAPKGSVPIEWSWGRSSRGSRQFACARSIAPRRGRGRTTRKCAPSAPLPLASSARDTIVATVGTLFAPSALRSRGRRRWCPRRARVRLLSFPFVRAISMQLCPSSQPAT